MLRQHPLLQLLMLPSDPLGALLAPNPGMALDRGLAAMLRGISIPPSLVLVPPPPVPQLSRWRYSVASGAHRTPTMAYSYMVLEHPFSLRRQPAYAGNIIHQQVEGQM